MQLKLRTLNRGKAARLDRFQAEFTACTAFHLDRVQALKTTSPTKIHQDCYREARAQFRLPASTLQRARDKAIAAQRAYLQRRKRDRRAKPPRFTKPLPISLAAENLRLFADKGILRVTTPDGFLWLPVIIPACFQVQVQQPHGASELVQRGRDWYLMLTVSCEDVPASDGERPHFGLDLGVANLAVLSGPGLVRFFDGKPLRYTRGRYFRSRQALQVKRKLSMVKRSKGKESRWATNENHRVSREVVDLMAAAGGVLHVEKLLGIRDRTKGTKKVNRMLHSWPFAQLLTFIGYKAQAAGVPVIEEDPRHTSQRCSRCGHTERGNRPKQADFRCKACGFRLHADLNAARNLAAKGAGSLGVGSVIEPLNGEVVGSSGHGNRNLASSA
jgi:IS605 OrfB family transposase